MKKSLHLFRIVGMLFCILLTPQVLGQTTKKIYPTISIVGITNNNGTYNKQTILSDPKTIIIGNDNNTIGRGYLEFDMSSIPSDATINSVGLQLNSKADYDSNFNGSIVIYQGVDGLSEANSVMWYQLEKIGVPMGTITFRNAGDGWDFQSAHLLALAKDKVKSGKKMYIQINHNDESKLVKLLGSTSDLFLQVVYSKVGGGGGEIPVGTVSGPDLLLLGETVEYEVPCIWHSLGESYQRARFSYPSLFVLDKGISTEVTAGNRLKAVKAGSGEIRVFIDHYNNITGRWETGKAEYYLHVSVLDYKLVQMSESKVIREGELITYKVEESHPANSIVWSYNSHVKLISGQGTNEAVFQTIGNGMIEIQTTVKYKTKTLTIKNSDVWVGPPIGGNNRIFDHTVGVDMEGVWLDAPVYGAESHKWYYPDGKLLSEDSKVFLSINWLRSYQKKGGGVFTHVGYNALGTGTSKATLYIQMEPQIPIERSLKMSEDTKNKTVSIKIYCLKNGLLVYQEKNLVNFNIQNTNLNPDIYILETTDTEGNIFREKVAKTNR